MSENIKAELYRFVKDRHDNFLQMRQGQKARIGHLLVMTGFIITILIIFGLPNLFVILKDAKGWGWGIAVLGVFAFIFVLIFLWLTLREHLRVLARMSFTIPYADPKIIMSVFNLKQIPEEYVYKNLVKMYLDSIEENQIESGYVGRHIRNIIKYLSWSLIIGLFFLAILVFAKIVA